MNLATLVDPLPLEFFGTPKGGSKTRGPKRKASNQPGELRQQFLRGRTNSLWLSLFSHTSSSELVVPGPRPSEVLPVQEGTTHGRLNKRVGLILTPLGWPDGEFCGASKYMDPARDCLAKKGWRFALGWTLLRGKRRPTLMRGGKRPQNGACVALCQLTRCSL